MTTLRVIVLAPAGGHLCLMPSGVGFVLLPLRRASSASRRRRASASSTLALALRFLRFRLARASASSACARLPACAWLRPRRCVSSWRFVLPRACAGFGLEPLPFVFAPACAAGFRFEALRASASSRFRCASTSIRLRSLLFPGASARLPLLSRLRLVSASIRLRSSSWRSRSRCASAFRFRSASASSRLRLASASSRRRSSSSWRFRSTAASRRFRSPSASSRLRSSSWRFRCASRFLAFALRFSFLSPVFRFGLVAFPLDLGFEPPPDFFFLPLALRLGLQLTLPPGLGLFLFPLRGGLGFTLAPDLDLEALAIFLLLAQRFGFEARALCGGFFFLPPLRDGVRVAFSQRVGFFFLARASSPRRLGFLVFAGSLGLVAPAPGFGFVLAPLVRLCLFRTPAPCLVVCAGLALFLRQPALFFLVFGEHGQGNVGDERRCSWRDERHRRRGGVGARLCRSGAPFERRCPGGSCIRGLVCGRFRPGRAGRRGHDRIGGGERRPPRLRLEVEVRRPFLLGPTDSDLRSLAASMNDRISAANRSGSKPAMDAFVPESFLPLRSSFPNRLLPLFGSTSAAVDANCGMVWVWTCCDPASVRRYVRSSSSSRGERSAVRRRTSGILVDSAATAASRESTRIRSAWTCSRTMRLRMVA